MKTIDRGDPRPLYPVEHSFVIALRRDSQAFPGQCAGRVEHLVSGQCAAFEHLQELLGFIASHMQAVGDRGGADATEGSFERSGDRSGGLWGKSVKPRPP